MLSTVLARPGDKTLTLIDTPGFSAVDQDEIADLARTVRDLPIEVQLVVPAYVRLAAAEQIFERFAKLKPAKLLLTHVDAVEGAASLIELAVKSGLPLSFFGTGQQVPEDIREAAKATLLEELAPNTLSISMAA